MVHHHVLISYMPNPCTTPMAREIPRPASRSTPMMLHRLVPGTCRSGPASDRVTSTRLTAPRAEPNTACLSPDLQIPYIAQYFAWRERHASALLLRICSASETSPLLGESLTPPLPIYLAPAMRQGRAATKPAKSRTPQPARASRLPSVSPGAFSLPQGFAPTTAPSRTVSHATPTAPPPSPAAPYPGPSPRQPTPRPRAYKASDPRGKCRIRGWPRGGETTSSECRAEVGAYVRGIAWQGLMLALARRVTGPYSA